MAEQDQPRGGGGGQDAGGDGHAPGLPGDQNRPSPPFPPSPSPAGGAVVDLQIERELKDSYLTYAMSTIMDRALPDVRDGLKPSQRRLLWAMNELGVRPGRKHMKCAKIVGETMGNYHPHGDSALYGTLVGMAQTWRIRVPLVQPQGNFGSIDGDPPAAMRYTEARMTAASADMLADADRETVDMQPNYDDTRQEPTVMPARFPNLLINGGVGIAVGMATCLPPHNPVEIFDAIARVIENPAISLAELMQDEIGPDGAAGRSGVKGPDFPTGGVILGRGGIVEAYATGRGKITLRGKVHVEEADGGGKDRKQIVIDQIPFMLSQGALVEKIVEAAKEEKIAEISDVRNESGREAQTRIVIELKRGADPAVVENQLYQFTPLQDTFSIMNIALVNRQPRTLSLKAMIEEYIRHREEVVRRRTAYLLREARKKAHVLEGMVLAVCDIDEVIRLIRASRTREEAIGRLMARRFRVADGHRYWPLLPERLRGRLREAEQAGGLLLSRVQAETIGNMRLILLTGLEIEKIAADYAALIVEIEGYERILADPRLVLDIIAKDCLEMRARYGGGAAGARQTEIQDSGGDITIAALIREEDMAVTISRQGYVKRVPLSTYRQQGRGGKGIRAGESADGDFLAEMFVASTHDDLLCFTDRGRVFRMKVYELPEMSRTSRGRAMVNLLDLRPAEAGRPAERTCAYLAIANFEAQSQYLLFASRGGVVKRTPLKDYRNVNRAGIIAVGLKEDDELLDVIVTGGSDDVLLATRQGVAIRFNEEDVRLMGRSAAGVKGIELEPGDAVIAAEAIPMIPDAQGDLQTADPGIFLLTITGRGYGKRTAIDEYRVQPEAGKMRSQSRGGKGRADIRLTGKNGQSVAALCVREKDDVVVMTSGGQLVRVAASSISRYGRGTQGVRVVSLNDNDEVVAAARVPDGGEGPADAADTPPEAEGEPAP